MASTTFKLLVLSATLADSVSNIALGRCTEYPKPCKGGTGWSADLSPIEVVRFCCPIVSAAGVKIAFVHRLSVRGVLRSAGIEGCARTDRMARGRRSADVLQVSAALSCLKASSSSLSDGFIFKVLLLELTEGGGPVKLGEKREKIVVRSPNTSVPWIKGKRPELSGRARLELLLDSREEMEEADCCSQTAPSPFPFSPSPFPPVRILNFRSHDLASPSRFLVLAPLQ